MAKKNLWLGMLVISLAFGTTVIGCDTPDEEKITGIWEDPFITSLEFKSNNTVDIWVSGWGTKTYSYRLSGKTLELTDNNGDIYSGNYKFEYSNQESRLIISGFPSVQVLHGLYFINRTYIKKK